MPFPYPGVGREVYPGFLQLSGFMAMNFDRHVNAHLDMFNHLVEGDGDFAEKHRDFYDEYLAVMDLTAEYLPADDRDRVRQPPAAEGRDEASRRARRLKAIRRVGLMTVEGEKDDISGVGQTRPRRTSAPNSGRTERLHYVQIGRRPLRRVQRFALPQGNRAARLRLPRQGRG